MITYKVVSKSDGHRFLIYKGNKKILYKSSLYQDYDMCVLNAQSYIKTFYAVK